MAEIDENDGPLTADEILQFGPAVESQVWTPSWLQEQRAPIAVAAGRPKFGPVFNSDGVGKMVAIRPCMSRGRRLRGLPPVYTPQMLERHAGVFDGWPMFLDHVPAELQAAVAKAGRSVKDLGGQVLKGHWDRNFTQEGDGDYGYRPGGTICEVWAAPVIRQTVGNNPNLLHTSINAWPTSGRPGAVPWRPQTKGMLIEGIRRQPQGSVDYVVRGGAGGRLLVAEGLEDEGAWPEIGEMSGDDVRVVVSLAESLYASPRMSDLVLPTDPNELRGWMQENAPHLLPAVAEAAGAGDGDADDAPKSKRKRKPNDGGEQMAEGLSREDVLALIQEAQQGVPTAEEFEERLREATDRQINEHAATVALSDHALTLIESAEGVLPSWKSDLKARYSLTADGIPTTLVVTEGATDDKGNALTPQQVVEARVTADLDRVRDLIAEARGKPRVTGEGGAKRDRSAEPSATKSSGAHWRKSFVSLGLAESEDKAIEVLGGKVEG